MSELKVSPQMKSASLQSSGQSDYRKGNFEAASCAFSAALDLDVVHDRIGILDNRAACCTRMSNFKAGLSDGRKMIKLDKTDPRGYLRTAKILQLMRTPELALGIYDYGLRHIPSSNEIRKTILTLRNKLQTALNPQKGDPLTKLPLELVEMIFQYLDFREIVLATRISKSWNVLIKALPRFWKSLDLSHCIKLNKRVKETTIRSYLRNANDHIDTAIIGGNHDSAAMKKIISMICRCRVQELVLVHDRIDKDFWTAIQYATNLRQLKVKLQTHCRFDDVYKFMTAKSPLQHLEVLHIKGVQPFERPELASKPESLLSLRSLKIERREPDDRRTADPQQLTTNIISSMPDLMELQLPSGLTSSLPDLVHFKILHFLDLSDAAFNTLPQLPPNLETLIVIGKTLKSARHGGFNFTHDLSSLRYLDVSRSTVIDAIDFLDSLTRNGTVCLQNLTMNHIFGAGPLDFDRLAGTGEAWAKLEKLRISDCPLVNDGIISLLKHTSNLRYFEACRTKITGVTIRQLVDGNKKVRYIAIDGCQEISADAIAFARASGKDVRYSNVDELRSAKRIRLM